MIAISPFAVLLFFSAVLTACLLGLVLRRRSTPGAPLLLLFLSGSLVWSLAYAMYWISKTPEARNFWMNMTYFGVVVTPGALFLFILRFTQRSLWLRRKWLWLFAVEPVLILVLVWTDSEHGLISAGARAADQGQIFVGGAAFWFNVIYSYSLILVGLLLLLAIMVRPGSVQRRQARLLLIGCVFPVLGNLVTFLGLNPSSGFDPTPVGFTITGVFLTYALFRYGLIELIPVGRDVLMERMEEGMLLLDTQLRLVDFNPAASRLLRLSPASAIGQNIHQALAEFPALVELLESGVQGAFDLDLERDEPGALHLQVTGVKDRYYGVPGRLVILRDVSEMKRNERELLEMNRLLQEQIRQINELQNDLRDQALRDPLTGVFNRRYLEETLPRELAKASRSQKPLSLVMLDIDNFKRLNDLYGHQAGDLALRRLSRLMAVTCRATDIVARFGGDEFVVVLIETEAEIALARVEEWRKLYAEAEITFEGVSIFVSLSAGIAAFPADGKDSGDLLHAADDAMYQAKSRGKNSIKRAGSMIGSEADRGTAA